MLGTGSCAAICLTAEMMMARVLSHRGVDGKFIGMNFLLIQGTIGTICLIIFTAMGEGIYITGLDGTLLMLLAGVTGVFAIGLL